MVKRKRNSRTPQQRTTSLAHQEPLPSTAVPTHNHSNSLLLQELLGRLVPAPPATAPQPHAIPNQAARQADDIPTPTSLLLRRNGHWDVHKLSTREAGVESVLDEVTSMLRAGDAALRSDYSTARAALQKPGVLEEHELQVLFDDPNVFVQQHIPAHGRAGLHGIVRLPCGDAHHVDRS